MQREVLQLSYLSFKCRTPTWTADPVYNDVNDTIKVDSTLVYTEVYKGPFGRRLDLHREFESPL
jgi:hypothetical protein